MNQHRNALALFVVRLRRRLAQLDPVDVTVLVEKSSLYRPDMLFELGADLSETVLAHEQGRVGDDAVREAALDVAVEACKVWIATVLRAPEGMAVDTGSEEGGDGNP